MKTTFHIESNQPYGWAVIAQVIGHDGRKEMHSEGTHPTKAAAANAIRGLKYAAEMSSADGYVRPRGM